MRTKYVFLFSLAMLIGLSSCDSKQTADTPTTIDQKVDSTPVSKETVVPAEKVSQTNTIESFWAVFQKAVADRDITTLNSLFAADGITKPYKFGDPEEQAKIAAGTASDITQDPNDPNLYLFRIIFPAQGESEESQTIIYLKKSDTGDYKIFNISFGG